MEMLGDEANKRAIAWLPHGKAFTIRKREVLSEVVLPRYFKACKYTSFTRKVSSGQIGAIQAPQSEITYLNVHFV
jgi:hypothetical protein